ncbi:MAG: deoxyribonuclease IV [Planctomycetes bacterium]|nr:deoxyribonuclease IV [Planctomycetota bacterium]
MSIAGGYYNAVLAARKAGCDTVQLFTKNNNQWRGKAMTDEDARLFALALHETGIKIPTAHNCYLINLASPDDTMWKRSTDAMVDEIRRSELLGLKYLVTHPGSHLESSVEAGLRRVAQAIDECHAQTPGAAVQILLEITAGQGTNLGYRFEHLARILDQVSDPDRLGVCFDTCHAFAAGYAMGTESDYRATMSSLDQTIGTPFVKAFHLNDSKREFGSRVDRHEHIGRGQLGLAPFRFLVNDPPFRRTPMYLETPKGIEKGKDLDVINLRTLRRLLTSK